MKTSWTWFFPKGEICTIKLQNRQAFSSSWNHVVSSRVFRMSSLLEYYPDYWHRFNSGDSVRAKDVVIHGHSHRCIASHIVLKNIFLTTPDRVHKLEEQFSWTHCDDKRYKKSLCAHWQLEYIMNDSDRYKGFFHHSNQWPNTMYEFIR